MSWARLMKIWLLECSQSFNILAIHVKLPRLWPPCLFNGLDRNHSQTQTRFQNNRYNEQISWKKSQKYDFSRVRDFTVAIKGKLPLSPGGHVFNGRERFFELDRDIVGKKVSWASFMMIAKKKNTCTFNTSLCFNWTWWSCCLSPPDPASNSTEKSLRQIFLPNFMNNGL